MSHQDQSGRRRYLIISILRNNMEAIFPPGFRKGMCNTAATESDKLIQCLIVQASLPDSRKYLLLNIHPKRRIPFSDFPLCTTLAFPLLPTLVEKIPPSMCVNCSVLFIWWTWLADIWEKIELGLGSLFSRRKYRGLGEAAPYT